MKKTVSCVDHYGNKHDISTERFIFRVSAYGVLKVNGKILFVQERWGKKWELPGGGVKPYERLSDALVREFKEETGLMVKPDKFITTTEDFFYAEDRDEAWHSLRYIYFVRKTDGELKIYGNNDDVVAAKFLKQSSLNADILKPAIYSMLSGIY